MLAWAGAAAGHCEQSPCLPNRHQLCEEVRRSGGRTHRRCRGQHAPGDTSRVQSWTGRRDHAGKGNLRRATAGLGSGDKSGLLRRYERSHRRSALLLYRTTNLLVRSCDEGWPPPSDASREPGTWTELCMTVQAALTNRGVGSAQLAGPGFESYSVHHLPIIGIGGSRWWMRSSLRCRDSLNR